MDFSHLFRTTCTMHFVRDYDFGHDAEEFVLDLLYFLKDEEEMNFIETV